MAWPTFSLTDWRDAPLDLTTPITRASLQAAESSMAAHALALNKLLPISRTLTSTGLTMLSSDIGQCVRMSNLVPRTFTIPSNAALPGIAVGQYFQLAAEFNPVTIAHDLGNSHLKSRLNLRDVAEEGGILFAWKYEAPDEWWLMGTLV